MDDFNESLLIYYQSNSKQFRCLMLEATLFTANVLLDKFYGDN